MERATMWLLDEVQKAAEGGVLVRVCGITVVFSLAGDADVTWDISEPAA